MLHEAYYLIRPQESLYVRVRDLGVGDVEWLLEPQLWRKGEPDRSPWNRDEHLAQVKLLFLAWLQSEYGAQEEYVQLFGATSVSLDCFDEWWSVERFYFPERVEVIERQLLPEAVRAIRRTGIANVDAWIDGLLGPRELKD
ncbi:hypothetical protein [Myxococcus xanthus]|uniref:hypothetical protein n=1 Tax=Myxococcus xanthus TaxID=34 RepID=UPI00112BFA5F|nr:hypothetical protein [Myxococcus xanthus]